MTATPVRSGQVRPWWLGPILWSGLSQVMSSVTNFGLVAALTVTADTAELGRVSAVLSVYLLGLATCRSLFSESMVASGRPDGDTWRWVLRRVSALAVAAIPVAGLVGAVVGLGASTALLLGLALPPLLIQDAWRYRAWARGRPSRAVILDVVWLVVAVVAGGAVVAARGRSGAAIGSSTILGVWCLGGAVSAALGSSVVGGGDGRAPTDPAGAVRDAASPGPATHRELARSQTTAALSFNLMSLGLATVLSPTLAGAARAVLLPFTPILSLVAGLRLVTLPALVRWAARPGGGGGRSPALAHAALGVGLGAPLAIGLAMVVAALPAAGAALELVGPHLPFGAAVCVLFIVAQSLADGVALGPARAATMRIRLVAVAVEWAGLLVGGGLGGVAGLVRGWAIGLGLAVLVWSAALLGQGTGEAEPPDR